MGKDFRGHPTMNIYVKIAIICATVFVVISILMFAVPFILLVFLGPETFIEPQIQVHGDCTINREGSDAERYLMIPEQSCELVCLDADSHDVSVRCQFESESISWDKTP